MKNTILKIITNRFLILSPLIGLIPIYTLWIIETHYVISAPVPVNYRDPDLLMSDAMYNIIILLISSIFLLSIPSIIGTITGIVLKLNKYENNNIPKLQFFIIPVLVYVIILLNIIYSSKVPSVNPFTALTWIMD